MKENISPAKTAISYGIIFGVIMILEFVIAYAFNIDGTKQPWVGVVNGLLNFLILPVLFIYLACSKFKNLNGGYISFGQCLKGGVSVNVIAALTFSVFNIIFNLIFPEFQQETFEKMKEMAVQQKPDMPAEQLEMSLSVSKMMMNPFVAAPISIMLYAFVGLIFSLVIAAIIKKDNPGEQYN